MAAGLVLACNLDIFFNVPPFKSKAATDNCRFRRKKYSAASLCAFVEGLLNTGKISEKLRC